MWQAYVKNTDGDIFNHRKVDYRITEQNKIWTCICHRPPPQKKKQKKQQRCFKSGFFITLGVVGITLNHSPGVPKDPTSLSDIAATDVYNQFGLGWFAQPVFGNGDYPEVMRWQVGNKSLEQGYSESRLPSFTEEEKAMLSGNALHSNSVMWTRNGCICVFIQKHVKQCHVHLLQMIRLFRGRMTTFH